MNLQDEIWETIRNEVAYLNGGSLDAQKGDLARQVADNLAPYMESVLAEAWNNGKNAAINVHPSWWTALVNPYRGDIDA